MNKRLKLLIFTVTLLVLATGIWAIADVKVLNLSKANFQDGQVLSAKTLNDLLNDNFGTLETAVTGLETSKQNRVGNPCPSGQFVRGVGVDGKLECAVDQVGSGGSAGVSSLNGKSGSLAIEAGDNVTIDNSKDGKITVSGTAGVDTINGMTAAVTLQAGDNITIDDSKAGQIQISAVGGASYSADETSLGLNGTTFFIRSSGVTTNHLADGAVTGAKIAMPLGLTGDTPSVASVLANANPAGMGLRVDLGSQPNTFVNTALMGQSTSGIGVYGSSTNNSGVQGKTIKGNGVFGESQNSTGVYGLSTDGRGVWGDSMNGFGVYGRTLSAGNSGVRGETAGTTVGYGVSGFSTSGIGVSGESVNNAGVFGRSTNNNAAFFTGGSGGTGSCSYNGGAGWNCTSDRDAKENFRTVDQALVLEQLAAMPVSTWSMKGDETQTPHLGPTAQDFYAAFNLGDSDTTINSADAQGVALAAIQGLYQLVQEQERRIAELEAQLAGSR